MTFKLERLHACKSDFDTYNEQHHICMYVHSATYNKCRICHSQNADHAMVIRYGVYTQCDQIVSGVSSHRFKLYICLKRNQRQRQRHAFYTEKRVTTQPPTQAAPPRLVPIAPAVSRTLPFPPTLSPPTLFRSNTSPRPSTSRSHHHFGDGDGDGDGDEDGDYCGDGDDEMTIESIIRSSDGRASFMRSRGISIAAKSAINELIREHGHKANMIYHILERRHRQLERSTTGGGNANATEKDEDGKEKEAKEDAADMPTSVQVHSYVKHRKMCARKYANRMRRMNHKRD